MRSATLCRLPIVTILLLCLVACVLNAPLKAESSDLKDRLAKALLDPDNNWNNNEIADFVDDALYSKHYDSYEMLTTTKPEKGSDSSMDSRTEKSPTLSAIGVRVIGAMIGFMGRLVRHIVS